MPSLKATLLALLSLLFIACNNRSGKIVKRDGDFYLVNTSYNDVYRFTLKVTKTIDGDSTINWTVGLILAPGSERWLAQEVYFGDAEIRKVIGLESPYRRIDKLEYKYEVTGQVKTTLSELREQQKAMTDGDFYDYNHLR
jgi:hypothetical protein